MKTVLILRHAKSSWASASLDDYDRPLNKRGKQDAPRMGALLAEQNLIPDLIVCSAAKRARSTAKRVAKACGYTGEIIKTDALYLSGKSAYLRLLQQTAESHMTILIVGHNPDMEQLIESLTGDYERMPTAALAQVTVDIGSWADLSFNGEHELVNLWRPKSLNGTASSV